MSRNIILCADGTGNKGGFTPDSNVYKTYHAIDIHHPSQTQISFYDNGVGTSTNKFFKAISGALGIGFQRNVRELYSFLCKNYHPDTDDKDAKSDPDKVFMFGFSRGAATIRALNGFVHDCGLIDARDFVSDKDLKKEVRCLMKIYLKARYEKDKATLAKLLEGQTFEGCRSKRNRAKIRFIGVWDTVAALGMPKRTDDTGPISKLLNLLFNGIDSIFDYFLHHRSYNFQLTPNITRACHAMSIDDERTAFWPRIWNELSPDAAMVSNDQVWFAGMHSDVGGGYERQGMSNVSLEWILEEAEKHGLKLNNNVIDDIRSATNVHDKMHDSRDGFGMFFRYHPRDIETLCKDEYNPQEDILKEGKIKIHDSVLSRLYYRTAGYAPNLLPGHFHVVNSAGKEVFEVDVRKDRDWEKNCSESQSYIYWLKELYIALLLITLCVLGYIVYLWNCQIDYFGHSGLWGHIADILQYFLPDLFNNFIELWVNQNPLGILSLLVVILGWWRTREFWRDRLLNRALAKRLIIMKEYTKPQGSDDDEQA